jgi:hypothetical protein
MAAHRSRGGKYLLTSMVQEFHFNFNHAILGPMDLLPLGSAFLNGSLRLSHVSRVTGIVSTQLSIVDLNP